MPEYTCVHKLVKWETIPGNKSINGMVVPAPERDKYIAIEEPCLKAGNHQYRQAGNKIYRDPEESHETESGRLWK